jgi:hypothetical protein
MSLRERTRPGLGIIEPCLPSPAKAPPSGPGWLHEIKHDGFRIMGSKADINTFHGMSALPLKADMCGATRDVRFGPTVPSKSCLKSEGSHYYAVR